MINALNYFNQYLKDTNQPDNPDIVLVNPPLDIYDPGQSGKYKTLPPFGLGILATMADNAGIKTVLVDCEAIRLSPDEICSIIDNLNPSVLGFNLTSPTVKTVKIILDKLHKSPNLLIAGGVHPTTLKDYTFNQIPRLDAIFIGESEFAWIEYLRLMNKTDVINRSFKDSLRTIPGVIVNGYPMQGIGNKMELDEVPFPARKYSINEPFKISGGYQAGILSSRGCPFPCKFCAAAAFTGRTIRFRSINNLVDEIEIMLNDGITHLHFGDDTFTVVPKRLKEFNTELKNRQIEIKWKSFSRTESITEKNLEYMKESGCHKLTFGIESGSDDVLGIMNKKQNSDDVRRAISLCKDFGIETKAFFMLGFPRETKKQMQQTIDFSIELGLGSAFFYIVRAFPGTELFNDIIKNGSNLSYNDLLDYQHIWPRITDNDLTGEQLLVKNKLEKEDIFDLSKTLKYNITHLKSISEYSIDELCKEMANAYIQFYFRQEYLDQL
jgi:anaerobic magnesium-protoporphyrin IX monomethyl ester cyclase|tara:strand:- start:3089 stop:4573 length:1485 start_codon:yes stop_codon:yes gene_type:complete